MEKETASNSDSKTSRSNRDLKRAAITELLQANPTEFLLRLQDDFDELQKKFGEVKEREVEGSENPAAAKARASAEEAADILDRLQRSVRKLVQQTIDETPLLHDTYFQTRLRVHRAFMALIGNHQFASPEALDRFLAPRYSQLNHCEHAMQAGSTTKACGRALQPGPSSPSTGVFDGAASIFSFGNAPAPSRRFHCSVCLIALCQDHASMRVTLEKLRPHVLAAPNFDVPVCAACHHDATKVGVGKIAISQQYIKETIMAIAATYLEFEQRKEALEKLQVTSESLAVESERFLSVVEHTFKADDVDKTETKANALVVHVAGDSFMFDAESLFVSSKYTKRHFDPYVACNHLKLTSPGRLDAVLFIVRKNNNWTKEEKLEDKELLASSAQTRCAIQVVVPKSAAVAYMPWYSVTKLLKGYYLETTFESKARTIFSYSEVTLTIRLYPFTPCTFELPGMATLAANSSTTSTATNTASSTSVNITNAGNDSILTTSITSVSPTKLPVRVYCYAASTGNMAIRFPEYALRPDIYSFGAIWTSVNTPLATVSHIKGKENERMPIACFSFSFLAFYQWEICPVPESDSDKSGANYVVIKAYQKEEYLAIVMGAQITKGVLVTTAREAHALACHWRLIQHVQLADKKQAYYGFCSLRPRLNEESHLKVSHLAWWMAALTLRTSTCICASKESKKGWKRSGELSL